MTPTTRSCEIISGEHCDRKQVYKQCETGTLAQLAEWTWEQHVQAEPESSESCCEGDQDVSSW